jgi:hypothetical protein
MDNFKGRILTYFEKIEKLKQIPQNDNDYKKGYFKGMKKGLEVALFFYKLNKKGDLKEEI